MKRSVGISASLFAFVLVVQSGCAAPPTNRAESQAVPTATTEVVDTAAIERDLMRIENDYPRALKEKDAATWGRVLADDAILIYPDGKLGDKATELKDIESGAMTFDSWELADLKVKVLDADAAITSGRVIVKNGRIKLPDNKTLDISGQYRFADTFHKRNGEWKLVSGVAVSMREPLPTTTPSPTTSPAAASPATSPAVTRSPATTASPAASRTP